MNNAIGSKKRYSSRKIDLALAAQIAHICKGVVYPIGRYYWNAEFFCHRPVLILQMTAKILAGYSKENEGNKELKTKNTNGVDS